MWSLLDKLKLPSNLAAGGVQILDIRRHPFIPSVPLLVLLPDIEVERAEVKSRLLACFPATHRVFVVDEDALATHTSCPSEMVLGDFAPETPATCLFVPMLCDDQAIDASSVPGPLLEKVARAMFWATKPTDPKALSAVTGVPALLERALGDRSDEWLALVSEFVADAERQYRIGMEMDRLCSTGKDVFATLLYHAVEKGLAIRKGTLRFPFSQNAVAAAVALIEDALTNGAELTERTGTLLNTLRVYDEYASIYGRSETVLEQLYDLLRRVDGHTDDKIPRPEQEGGVTHVTREDIHRRGKKDLSDFFASRYSVRVFSRARVDTADIENAVRLAQKTPSHCNRQGWGVWALRKEALTPEDWLEVLELQGGTLSFKNELQLVLVITTRVDHFLLAERHAPWVDGGLFAMSLGYAFHSIGLGTCMLNWNRSQRSEQRLRDIVGIPKEEGVVMMMAVGHLEEEFSVPRSARRPVSTVLRFAGGSERDAPSPAVRPPRSIDEAPSP